MTGTPDAHHGELLEDEGVLLSPSTDPTVEGEIRYSSGALKAKDGTGVFNLRTGGPHAPTHHEDGSDELLAQDLGSGEAPEGQLLRTDGTGGWDLVDYVPGYPAALEYASDNTTSTTTSSTFQVKLTYTTANLALGHYLVFAQAVLSGSANNTETEGQFLVGATIVQTLAARLSRVGAEFALFSMYVLDEVSGPQTFTIQYRKSGGSGSASIRDARVIMWRLF